MKGVVAITDADSALGLRLAGIETLAVESDDEARARLTERLEARDCAVVVYDEGSLSSLPEGLQRRIEESTRPIFIPVPFLRSWQEGEKREEYLVRLLRRTIGYHIRLQR